MKLLIKKIANSEIGILLRNSINFKPVYIKHSELDSPVSISDAFLWRTDNGYKTKFKYSDILALFYKVKNSRIEIQFYTKNNELIKIEKISSVSLSNELEITSSFLNNIEDYGVFYIYHYTDKNNLLKSTDIISNRCYVGYSKNDQMYSFIHGNTLARYKTITSKKEIFTDLVKTSLFKNYIYTIQKFFNGFDKNEFFFINPTSKTVKFIIENKRYILKPGCATLLKININIISIRSNCLFLRPTIFSYKGGYLDVHHS